MQGRSSDSGYIGPMTRRLLVVWLAGLIGLLAVGCSSSGNGSSAGTEAANAGSSASGDPREILLAALTKMDELDTYQAEMSMPAMDLGGSVGQMTTSSHIEANVEDDVVYQVTEVSGGPIGTSKQETLIRGSEYLVRSDLFAQSLGGGADTWFRAPVANEGGTMIVSMYFAPAGQAITAVSEQGTETVRGTEVTIYRAELDPAKFRDAMSAGNIPGGIPADKIPAPTTVDYGVGDDGYVHSIAFAMGSGAPPTTIELHDYNSELNVPDPTHIVDMPK